MYDVAIIGGGIAGVATAMRLQARGLATVVFEAHGQPGGCAGFFRRKGFCLRRGGDHARRLRPGGVGGELLESVGMTPIEGEELPGYVAWLPDRTVTLFRDPAAWSRERLKALGDTPAHRSFWRLLDRLADVFWRASRAGVKLPIRGWPMRSARCGRSASASCPWLATWVGRWPTRCGHTAWSTIGRSVGLLAMLVEDTVHSTLAEAPLINAALGITIRGAGLTRAAGGMRGFWNGLDRPLSPPWRRVARRLCGRAGRGAQGAYRVTTRRGVVEAEPGRRRRSGHAGGAAGSRAGRGGAGAVPPP